VREDLFHFFFFQAEDGIRDLTVTGVQTCALPIWKPPQAMAGGGFRAPCFTVAWPTEEFGGMGLEGAVKLGYRKELAAVEDPAARKALFDQMVARAYEHGKALNTASHFEIDDVIDPVESRH